MGWEIWENILKLKPKHSALSSPLNLNKGVNQFISLRLTVNSKSCLALQRPHFQLIIATDFCIVKTQPCCLIWERETFMFGQQRPFEF